MRRTTYEFSDSVRKAMAVALIIANGEQKKGCSSAYFMMEVIKRCVAHPLVDLETERDENEQGLKKRVVEVYLCNADHDDSARAQVGTNLEAEIILNMVESVPGEWLIDSAILTLSLSRNNKRRLSARSLEKQYFRARSDLDASRFLYLL